MRKITISFLGSLLTFFLSIYIASPVFAAPVISNVQITPSVPYTATFRWDTSTPSDSWIDFDPNGTRNLSSLFYEYRDPKTNEMLGRCDGGGNVVNHCVSLLTPAPGKAYQFRIRSCDASDQCSVTGILSFTSAPDTKIPIRPTSLALDRPAESDHVALRWRASTDNAPRHFPGYKVYRNSVLIKTIDPVRYTPIENFTISSASSVTIESAGLRDIDLNVPLGLDQNPVISYTDYTVSPKTKYTYYVVAFDLSNNKSLPSNAIETTTPQGCPDGFLPTEKQLVQDGPFVFACVPVSPPEGDIPPPPDGGIISNVNVATTPYTATLTWDTTIPTDSWVDFDSDGSRYVLQGSTFILRDPIFYDYLDPGTGQMVGRCDGGGNVTKHCVKIVTPAPARLYPFRIKSCSSGAQCEFTAILSFTSALDTARPTVPNDLRTNVTGTGDVELTWNPSRDNAPRYFPGYKIFRNNALIKIITPSQYTPTPPYRNLDVNVPIELNATRIQYVDFDVLPNTTYTYYVTALDPGGNESLPSSVISVSTAPVTDTPIITNIETLTTVYTVTFTWKTVTPSDSWVDLDQDGNRYILRGDKYELVDPLRYIFPEHRDPITGQMVGRCDGGGNVINHCVKIVTPAPAKLYPFRLRSCSNSTKCGFSTISSFISAPDTTRPTVPTGLRTNVTVDNVVQLTWEPSRDNAPRHFPGYKIYKNDVLINTINPVRYLPPDGDLNTNVPIAVNNTNIQYVDTDVAVDAISTYYVTAIDLGGNESVPSLSNSIQCIRNATLLCAPALSHTLQLESTGEDVKILQQLLIQEGVYPEAIVSGYFGLLTRQAVIRFQKKYLIDPVGIVGPITRAKINKILLNNLGNLG